MIKCTFIPAHIKYIHRERWEYKKKRKDIFHWYCDSCKLVWIENLSIEEWSHNVVVIYFWFDNFIPYKRRCALSIIKFIPWIRQNFLSMDLSNRVHRFDNQRMSLLFFCFPFSNRLNWMISTELKLFDDFEVFEGILFLHNYMNTYKHITDFRRRI